MKLTEAGGRDIKSAPKRIEASIKAFEGMGGKMISLGLSSLGKSLLIQS